MIAAVFAGTLAVVLLLQRGERDEVSSYMRRVEEAQQSFALRYGSINQAYEQLQRSPDAIEPQLPQLRRNARTLTAIRSQIAAIDAPKPATELRRQMIALLSLQEAVAYELLRVAEYLPVLQEAERPIARANDRLAKSLRSARDIEEQGVAVGRYARELRAVAERLARIEPPALLAPSHSAYVAQLRRYTRWSAGLARAAASGEREAIATAGARFRRAPGTPSGTARAQKRAIEAYNRRIARIHSLGLAVERERRRLDRMLG